MRAHAPPAAPRLRGQVRTKCACARMRTCSVSSVAIAARSATALEVCAILMAGDRYELTYDIANA